MNRRGFLTKMLGATGAASAFALVPATAEEAKVIDAGEFDFASLPRGGFYIREIRIQVDDPHYLFTDLVPPCNMDIKLRSAGDPRKLLELGRFLRECMGKVL